MKTHTHAKKKSQWKLQRFLLQKRLHHFQQVTNNSESHTHPECGLRWASRRRGGRLRPGQAKRWAWRSWKAPEAFNQGIWGVDVDGGLETLERREDGTRKH